MYVQYKWLGVKRSVEDERGSAYQRTLLAPPPTKVDIFGRLMLSYETLNSLVLVGISKQCPMPSSPEGGEVFSVGRGAF